MKMSGFGSHIDPKHFFRFAPRPGNTGALQDRVVEVRKLLRSNMSLTAIAKELGVTDKALTRFIRQRGLGDMKARREFISRLKSTGQIEK
jgi:Trp operon repressor